MTSSTCWSTSSISLRITPLSLSISRWPRVGFWMISASMSTAIVVGVGRKDTYQGKGNTLQKLVENHRKCDKDHQKARYLVHISGYNGCENYTGNFNLKQMPIMYMYTHTAQCPC